MNTITLPGCPNFPIVVQPTEKILNAEQLTDWIGANREQMRSGIIEQGALLFRGFGFRSATEFQRFSQAFAPNPANYVRGASPRRHESEFVYNSTELPANWPLALHCELAYVPSYPEFSLFCCQVAPQVGGQTSVGDMAKVYQAIRGDVRDRFEQRGIRYIQNVPARKKMFIARTWAQMFETDDRAEVEAHCRRESIDFRWNQDGGLQLINHRPAVVRHPQTGQKIWFNQTGIFHPASWTWHLRHSGQRVTSLLSKAVKTWQRIGKQPEDFPMHCTFGDGSEISRSDLHHVFEVLADHQVLFDWQPGDVLLLDNQRIAHGKQPFRGPRKILVAMGNITADSKNR